MICFALFKPLKFYLLDLTPLSQIIGYWVEHALQLITNKYLFNESYVFVWVFQIGMIYNKIWIN